MQTNAYVPIKPNFLYCGTALAAVLLFLIHTFHPGTASAFTDLQTTAFTVDSPQDEPDANPGDGTCASTPSGACTLRAAVQEANALAGADTITLPAGTYTLTIPGRDEHQAASGDLDLTESLTLQGGGSANTILDANGIDRALQIFGPAQVTLTNLTIQNGDSGTGLGTSGGGIAVGNTSQLTMEDVILRSNHSGDSGGGIYNNGGTLVLRRVQVADNTAATAAGIRNSGALTITDASITNNQAAQTGGGLLNTGSLALESSTISGNTANTNGGGLYLHSADPQTGTVTIHNSTISGNQARSFMGGGIWVYYQTELWVTWSTIAGNTAGQGGGIYNYHQQALLAPQDPSAPDNPDQEGNIHLQDSLVANNTFANCGRSPQTEPIHSLGGNLDSGTSCEFSPSLGDLVDSDPLLGMLQDNGGPTWTHALAEGSPAVDAVDGAACPPSDQRGVTRPQGSSCDIGAFELGPAEPVIYRYSYLPLAINAVP